MTIEKFWQITWRDFSIYLLGHQRKEIAEWERTREVAYIVYCMGQWSGTRESKTKLFPLPSDGDFYVMDRGKPITNNPEERKKLFEEIHKRYNRIKEN